MLRLKKLNLKHGISASIHVYNVYYGGDLLRCSDADFNAVLNRITHSDILRVRALVDVDVKDLPQVA
jgi:hypothetical protein